MDLARRFAELDRFLRRHRQLWSERPFVQEVAWARTQPQLARWALALSPRAVARYERGLTDLAAEAPAPLDDPARAALELIRLPTLSSEVAVVRGRVCWRVPGRKVAQVAAFADALERWTPPGSELLDWCAGKGFLGRLLAARGRQVTNIEQRGALCRVGERLDHRAGVRCRWVEADVHGARELLREDTCVMALHACGELHRTLVVAGARQRMRALMLAPCCYHRARHDEKEPVSRDGMAGTWRLRLPRPPPTWCYRPLSNTPDTVTLDEHALRLATSAEVVARGRESRARARAQVYRLALDRLVRESTGEDRYHPLPPLPARWLRRPLEEFLERAAAELGIAAPRRVEALEQWARRRQHRARALGLVRGVFRRPLELWLALDIALYLQERRYEVQLGTFCPEQVTPRNLLIAARR